MTISNLRSGLRSPLTAICRFNIVLTKMSKLRTLYYYYHYYYYYFIYFSPSWRYNPRWGLYFTAL